MKAKYIILLVACAIVTLSFTVVTTSSHKAVAEKGSVSNSGEPLGGQASEDPLK
jgi:hypothetical protein